MLIFRKKPALVTRFFSTLWFEKAVYGAEGLFWFLVSEVFIHGHWVPPFLCCCTLIYFHLSRNKNPLWDKAVLRKWPGNRKSKRGSQWPSGGTSNDSLPHARPNLLLSTTFQSCRIMNLPVRLVPSWSNHEAKHFAHSFFSTSNWTSDLNDNKPEIRST